MQSVKALFSLFVLSLSLDFQLVLSLSLNPSSILSSPATEHDKAVHEKCTKVNSSDSKSNTPETMNEHCLGPPGYLGSLPLNQRSGSSLHRYDTFGSKQEFEVLHLSSAPEMFLLRNYVSIAERYTLQWHGRNHPKEFTVYDEDERYGRTKSNVSWLPPHAANGIPLQLARCSSKLLLSSTMQNGIGGAGMCEPMQLVRYEEQGEFVLHHDALGRVATVLCYLNGVAGTWFPLTKFNQKKYKQQRNKEQALRLIHTNDMQPGRDGLLIATNQTNSEEQAETANDAIVYVGPGDALVFYNYDLASTDANHHADVIRSSPELDWRAIHAGLPATEEKLIATQWFQGGSLTNE